MFGGECHILGTQCPAEAGGCVPRERGTEGCRPTCRRAGDGAREGTGVRACGSRVGAGGAGGVREWL